MEIWRDTSASLRAHAYRFSLTSLGIMWGTLMLTYLSATVSGAQQHFATELGKVGQRIVWVFPGSVTKERVGERGARGLELENADVERVRSLRSVQHSDPNLMMWSCIVRAASRTRLLTLFGVTPDARSIRNYKVASGRFLSPEDLGTGARTAFLGAEAATRLFGNAPALGRIVQVESLRLRVVGVAERKGSQLVNMSGADDEAIFIPQPIMQRWLKQQQKRVEAMIIQANTDAGSWDAMRHIRQLVGLHHNFDPNVESALSFFNIQEAMLIVRRLFAGLHAFLLGASALTLLIGAIGVMNIMLVVVGERRREIGLRKAVGATNRAIFIQFLIEAASVAIGAGVVGAIVGLAVVQLLASRLPPDDPTAVPPLFEPLTAGVVAMALSMTAVAAGLLPAIRASQIAPADALRDL